MKISDIQDEIKKHDHSLNSKNEYFLKLIEEVGELSEAIRKSRDGQSTTEEIKGSIAEELNDILYYVCALANVHGVDLTKTYELKESINRAKYQR